MGTLSETPNLKHETPNPNPEPRTGCMSGSLSLQKESHEREREREREDVDMVKQATASQLKTIEAQVHVVSE